MHSATSRQRRGTDRPPTMGKKKSGKGAAAAEDGSATGSAPAPPEPTPAAAEPPPEPVVDETDEEEEEGDTKANARDGGDISKVTDYVEHKELDSARASRAIASIATEMEVDWEAERERERELAAVTIDQARCPAVARPSL